MVAVNLPSWTVAAAWLALCWLAVGVDEWRNRRRPSAWQTDKRGTA